MPRDSESTRRHILDCAYEQFYRKGFGRVGVDEIAAASGVTKRTVYYHFESKDELLSEVLALQHELALAHIRKYQDRYSGNAEDVVTLLFSELARWSREPSWTGAGFTRLAMELADLPGHPARKTARQHKAEVEAWYSEILARAGAARPAEIAREIAILAEGAMALILIHGNTSYAEVAASAARQLVRSRGPGTSDEERQPEIEPDG